jgi:hypothetical protein
MSEVTPLVAVPSEEPEVSEELKAKVQSIRAFAEAHNILAVGQYNCSQFETVINALRFLKGLHDEAIKQACADKGAWRVPELKEFLDKQQGDNKDGAA